MGIDKLFLLAGSTTLAVLIIFLVTRFFIGKEINYKSHFTLGIVWSPMGIALDNYWLAGIGVAFLIIGLVNYKSWRKDRNYKK